MKKLYLEHVLNITATFEKIRSYQSSSVNNDIDQLTTALTILENSYSALIKKYNGRLNGQDLSSLTSGQYYLLQFDEAVPAQFLLEDEETWSILSTEQQAILLSEHPKLMLDMLSRSNLTQYFQNNYTNELFSKLVGSYILNIRMIPSFNHANKKIGYHMRGRSKIESRYEICLQIISENEYRNKLTIATKLLLLSFIRKTVTDNSILKNLPRDIRSAVASSYQIRTEYDPKIDDVSVKLWPILVGFGDTSPAEKDDILIKSALQSDGATPDSEDDDLACAELIALEFISKHKDQINNQKYYEAITKWPHAISILIAAKSPNNVIVLQNERYERLVNLLSEIKRIPESDVNQLRIIDKCIRDQNYVLNILSNDADTSLFLYENKTLWNRIGDDQKVMLAAEQPLVMHKMLEDHSLEKISKRMLSKLVISYATQVSIRYSRVGADVIHWGNNESISRSDRDEICFLLVQDSKLLDSMSPLTKIFLFSYLKQSDVWKHSFHKVSMSLRNEINTSYLIQVDFTFDKQALNMYPLLGLAGFGLYDLKQHFSDLLNYAEGKLHLVTLYPSDSAVIAELLVKQSRLSKTLSEHDPEARFRLAKLYPHVAKLIFTSEQYRGSKSEISQPQLKELADLHGYGFLISESPRIIKSLSASMSNGALPRDSERKNGLRYNSSGVFSSAAGTSMSLFPPPPNENSNDFSERADMLFIS